MAGLSGAEGPTPATPGADDAPTPSPMPTTRNAGQVGDTGRLPSPGRRRRAKAVGLHAGAPLRSRGGPVATATAPDRRAHPPRAGPLGCWVGGGGLRDLRRGPGPPWGRVPPLGPTRRRGRLGTAARSSPRGLVIGRPRGPARARWPSAYSRGVAPRSGVRGGVDTPRRGNPPAENGRLAPRASAPVVIGGVIRGGAPRAGKRPNKGSDDRRHSCPRLHPSVAAGVRSHAVSHRWLRCWLNSRSTSAAGTPSRASTSAASCAVIASAAALRPPWAVYTMGSYSTPLARHSAAVLLMAHARAAYCSMASCGAGRGPDAAC